MLCQLSYGSISLLLIKEIRQRSTLPGGRPPSTIDAIELNFCVRYGNRWFLNAIATGFFFLRLLVCTLKTKQCSSDVFGLLSNSLRSLRFTLYLALRLFRDCARRVFALQTLIEQALGLLVPFSYIHYCTSTYGLSIRYSPGALTPFVWEILS